MRQHWHEITITFEVNRKRGSERQKKHAERGTQRNAYREIERDREAECANVMHEAGIQGL